MTANPSTGTSGNTQLPSPVSIEAVASPIDSMPSPNLRDLVAFKQASLKIALTELSQILDCIEEDVAKVDQSWVQCAEAIMREYKTFSYQVGVAGDTGMGKTSLMNALIGHYIAPESQSGACTAAVCRFKYNKNQEKSQFRTIVEFKSKDTVDSELQNFFSTLNEVDFGNSKDGDDEEEEAYLRDEKERCDQYLQIASTWSGLDVTTLRRYGSSDKYCSEITSRSAATDFFDMNNTGRRVSLELTGKTSKIILKLLRPYVSGTKSDTKFWPLVECVTIYVPSEFLRGGLTLVDLPGELNTTKARSDVAKRYYNKLDSLMIVTPCDRAADNKTATDMLRADQVLDLDAAGRIDNGMCIVSTRIDQMEWQKFVDSAMPAEDINPEFSALMEEFEAKQTELEDDRASAEMRAGVEELETKCLSHCIRARNREITQALQQYFDKIRYELRKRAIQFTPNSPCFQ